MYRRAQGTRMHQAPPPSSSASASAVSTSASSTSCSGPSALVDRYKLAHRDATCVIELFIYIFTVVVDMVAVATALDKLKTFQTDREFEDRDKAIVIGEALLVVIPVKEAAKVCLFLLMFALPQCRRSLLINFLPRNLASPFLWLRLGAQFRDEFLFSVDDTLTLQRSTIDVLTESVPLVAFLARSTNFYREADEHQLNAVGVISFVFSVVMATRALFHMATALCKGECRAGAAKNVTTLQYGHGARVAPASFDDAKADDDKRTADDDSRNDIL